MDMRAVGSALPAAYLDVTANTTAVPCAISVHTPAVLPACLLEASSFKPTLELAAERRKPDHDIYMKNRNSTH